MCLNQSSNYKLINDFNALLLRHHFGAIFFNSLISESCMIPLSTLGKMAVIATPHKNLLSRRNGGIQSCYQQVLTLAREASIAKSKMMTFVSSIRKLFCTFLCFICLHCDNIREVLKNLVIELEHPSLPMGCHTKR